MLPSGLCTQRKAIKATCFFHQLWHENVDLVLHDAVRCALCGAQHFVHLRGRVGLKFLALASPPRCKQSWESVGKTRPCAKRQ